ncbi:hypothetical protein PIB30_010551 [Stylosanthes scabra]|uniref:Uncharacterized protein n=1 Tax=Stylosanthes scabra TaxID=79078 RepID=A0ABU6R4F9_9FABA|nr:hypothetical protein [Stylosanthes scabra]
MASLISSVGHYCCIRKALLAHHLKNRIIVSSCHGRRPSNDSINSQQGTTKDMDGGKLKNNSLVKLRLLSLLNGFERFGSRKAKQILSPEQKGGDWKDLVLMSLSFAVYVYISQKLVCAYFVWTTMPKQLW